MAHITLAGTLLAPNGSNAVGDKIRFTHRSTTGATIQNAVSILTVAPDGSYAIELEYGLVLVEYKEASNPNFKNRGTVTVNSDNPATSIPELLNAIVPVSTAELIEFQTILADCVTAKAAAETAAVKGAVAAALFQSNAGAGVIGTSTGASVQESINALSAGQTGGLIVFTTYELLNSYTPAAAEENTSFKVTNDSNTSLNGYYSWVSGATYTKDAELSNGVIESGNNDAVSGGAVFSNVDVITPNTNNLFTGDDSLLRGFKINTNGSISGAAAVEQISPQYSVTAGQYITFSGLDALTMNMLSNRRRGYFYDTGGNPLTVFSFPSSIELFKQKEFTIQATQDGYIQFNTAPTIENGFQLEYGQTATQYFNYKQLTLGMTKEAFLSDTTSLSRNIYDGSRPNAYYRSGNTGIFTSSLNPEDSTSTYIKIEHGKTYTISGVELGAVSSKAYVTLQYDNYSVGGVTTAGVPIGYADVNGEFTFTNVDHNYLTIQLGRLDQGSTVEKLDNLHVQVEEGATATNWTPHRVDNGAKQYEEITAVIEQRKPIEGATLDNFEVNLVNANFLTQGNFGPSLEIIKKGDISTFIAASGVTHYSKGVAGEERNNSLIGSAIIEGNSESTYEIFTDLHCFDGDGTTEINSGNAISVPSGGLDNPNSIQYYQDRYRNDGYVHPSIAYTPTAIGGFKYWVVASILPQGNDSLATWEDEDILVSNDAINWQRIRSLYETDKSYTTATLRLPPNQFATSARVNQFLPIPEAGMQVEISTNPLSGGAVLDKQVVTIEGGGWKHDPAIIIDNGYVYILHTYHLAYNGLTANKNKFLVLTRTSNGVDWECVRQDGTTLPLTSATESSKIFTKSASGEFNYSYNGWVDGSSNPEFVKYGNNDYELLYGYNFSKRLAGTEVWNIDFYNPLPIQDLGSGNHPGTLYDGTTLYLLNNFGFYHSSDRGVSFTKYQYYAPWQGGSTGATYKKSMCIGENGKVTILQVARYLVSGYKKNVTSSFSGIGREHCLFSEEFESITDLTDRSTNEKPMAYIDLQYSYGNKETQIRSMNFTPKATNTLQFLQYNMNAQKVKIGELDLTGVSYLDVALSINTKGASSVRCSNLYLTPKTSQP